LLLLLPLLGLSKVGGELSIGIFATRDIPAGMTLLMVSTNMRLQQAAWVAAHLFGALFAARHPPPDFLTA
jgi:cytochrome c oxidase assembly factor CtaG